MNVDDITYDFLRADNLRLENTERVLLYEVNPVNILNETQIATLKRIANDVLEQRPVEFSFVAIFEGGLNSDFTITFYFGVVALVELD